MRHGAIVRTPCVTVAEHQRWRKASRRLLTRAHRRIECDGRWVVQAATKPAGLAQARGYVAYLRRSPGGPRVINPRGGDITQAPGGRAPSGLQPTAHCRPLAVVS